MSEDVAASYGGTKFAPGQEIPKGTYRVRLYGRAASLLYEAYYPSLTTFSMTYPNGGLNGVVAIQIDWLEWTP